MPLTPDEKTRVLAHLGYPVVDQAAGMSFGIPIPLQTLFLVQSAVNYISEGAVPRARQILGIMDAIEAQLVDGQSYLPASSVDDIKVRPDHLERLRDEYADWGQVLGNLMGAFPYPLAVRYRGRMGGATGAAGNVKVMR